MSQENTLVAPRGGTTTWESVFDDRRKPFKGGTFLNQKNVAKRKFTCERQNYFGETLKEIRAEKNLTQSEAANLLDVTQAQWSAYELGKTRPTLDIVLFIAQALDVDPFELLSRSLDKSPLLSKKVLEEPQLAII